MRFCFVGLGQMGAPMARNLARAHDVVALDSRPERQAAAGVPTLAGFGDLAAIDALILCVPNGDVVEDILFAEAGGLAAHLPAGAVIIDTSTIAHGQTLRIAGRLGGMGLRFLDAPVSGMQKRAEDATLTMMIGGDAAVIDTLRPALSTMANTILHTGAVGSGQLTKLINQLLFDINAAAIAEIMPMATKLGLDPETTAQVVNTGTGRSYASEYFLPQILDGVFDTGYPLAAAYKDIVNGAEISARHQIPAPVLAAAAGTYQQALREGHGALDKGAMVKVFERLLDVSCAKDDRK